MISPIWNDPPIHVTTHNGGRCENWRKVKGNGRPERNMPRPYLRHRHAPHHHPPPGKCAPSNPIPLAYIFYHWLHTAKSPFTPGPRLFSPNIACAIHIPLTTRIPQHATSPASPEPCALIPDGPTATYQQRQRPPWAHPSRAQPGHTRPWVVSNSGREKAHVTKVVLFCSIYRELLRAKY